MAYGKINIRRNPNDPNYNGYKATPGGKDKEPKPVGSGKKPKPGFGINPPKPKPGYGIMPVPKPGKPKPTIVEKEIKQKPLKGKPYTKPGKKFAR